MRRVRSNGVYNVMCPVWKEKENVGDGELSITVCSEQKHGCRECGPTLVDQVFNFGNMSVCLVEIISWW